MIDLEEEVEIFETVDHTIIIDKISPPATLAVVGQVIPSEEVDVETTETLGTINSIEMIEVVAAVEILEVP